MGRTRSAKGSGNAPAAKKTCLETPQISGIDVRWEWEGDGGKWMQYRKQRNIAMIKAFNEKKKQFQFDVAPKVTLVSVFETMIQRNKKTGWERRLRLAVKDTTDEEYYVWMWKDEHGKLRPYGVSTTVELEEANTNNESSFDIVASHRSYTVDIKQMEQVNTVTKVKRKIVREKSAATEDEDDGGDEEAEDEVPSTSSSIASASNGAKSAGKSKGKPSAKSGKGSGRGKSTRLKKEDDKEDDEEPTKSSVRTVVVKGKAPVDPECFTLTGKAHVFFEGKTIWDCMLNQTDVKNNNNKYYMIQLLEEDTKKSFYVWQRWGRVGYKGQTNLVPCGGDIDKAKNIYCKKFSDKTKNDWAMRHKFEKVAGKYDMIEMDYSGGKGRDETDAPSIKKEDSMDTDAPDSSLDKRLQDLINLICDVTSMEEAVMEMKYDAKKAPLGKLTGDQIKAGYAALKKIDVCINKNDFGSNLVEACNEFYTRIPHVFGMKTPPLIRTKQTVKEKILLLEALDDIEIAIKMLKKGDMSENPIDRHYHSLKCELDPLDHSHDEFKLMDDFLQRTHASTHNQYKMQLLDVFKCDKQGESKQFTDLGNRMLLWHGSRLTNWVGILSQGLRIAPPEAPVTGYMFGKGVYFADMSSKSANYCFTSRAKPTGILLVCEVSLGTVNELLAADYTADKLPPGKHSVKGVGRIAPDSSSHKTLTDGTVVPVGKGKDTGITNPHGYTLNYNEFIVYDTKQIKMKYLLKIKFNFK